MVKSEAEKILYCAMSVGEALLCYGAEVGRVEDTIRRICRAYGATRVDVFSITSSIITTMYMEEGESYTQTRRVAFRGNDMTRLDALNRLSRRICGEGMSTDEVVLELKNIENCKQYSFAIQLIIYALISGSFSVFFGGDAADMLASAVIGILLKLFETLVRPNAANSLISALLCAVVGGLLSHLAVLLHFGSHADLISIGNVMLMIPGSVFTNSLRDLFSGDTITGLVRFMESLLMAATIALGFAIAATIL